ncbi:HAD family hydrolase [Croceiramulus getboli]|nr:HAD family phosphatase [Flavobacteriaceae bacterium YJPT1-3]
MKPITTIIFDLGGVLIDWSPEYVYLKEFKGDRDRMNWFLDTVCAWDWNEQQDAGYPLDKATEERVAKYPEYERLIRMYYGHWEEMLGHAHEGTVALLNQLFERKEYMVYALTNWSGETFPKAMKKFEFLHRFDGIVVSGDEGMKKPSADIYHLLLERYEVDPEEAVFIDDNLKNVVAAQALGIRSIPFSNPDQLAWSLKTLGVTF